MRERHNSVDPYSLEPFRTQKQIFSKKHAEAKDYVKFLSTLERQFKNISKGELTVIEETLPSLLNGLKLVWTISRHINQDEEKMEEILYNINDEICDKVKAKIDLKKIFTINPNVAVGLINQAISVLDRWEK